MPEMTGAEFCVAFAAEFGRDATRIVVMTAATAAEAERIRQACQADALVGKPFDVAELLRVVAVMAGDAAP